MANQKAGRSGFSLIELLTTVAIISLLAAIAIPQYQRFARRTQRTESVIILSATHKAQMSYFSSFDRFKQICDQVICLPSIIEPLVLQNHYDMGLQDVTVPAFNTTFLFTPSGYTYAWLYTVGATNYTMRLQKNLNPDIPGIDSLYIGVDGWGQANCAAYGFQNGVPYLRQDDLTGKNNCAP